MVLRRGAIRISPSTHAHLFKNKEDSESPTRRNPGDSKTIIRTELLQRKFPDLCLPGNHPGYRNVSRKARTFTYASSAAGRSDHFRLPRAIGRRGRIGRRRRWRSHRELSLRCRFAGEGDAADDVHFVRHLLGGEIAHVERFENVERPDATEAVRRKDGLPAAAELGRSDFDLGGRGSRAGRDGQSADGESAVGVDGAVTVNWASGAGSLEKVMPRTTCTSFGTCSAARSPT